MVMHQSRAASGNALQSAVGGSRHATGNPATIRPLSRAELRAGRRADRRSLLVFSLETLSQAGRAGLSVLCVLLQLLGKFAASRTHRVTHRSSIGREVRAGAVERKLRLGQ